MYDPELAEKIVMDLHGIILELEEAKRYAPEVLDGNMGFIEDAYKSLRQMVVGSL